jgi:3-methyl-2-oxobutanoate hydroxymethyltransferase
MEKQKTILDFQALCSRGEKIVVVTAYDYAMALAADAAGVDSVLVGDSLSTTMLGRPTTLPTTLEEMIHHCKAVTRGVRKALVIGDMPFRSYQLGPDQAFTNASRLVAETGVGAVKLEWCAKAAESTRFLVENGIPVMGHVGFTPQQYHQFGGYHLQGKDKSSASLLLKQAKAFEKAGAFSLVLELVPSKVSQTITRSLKIPTIGIGAGPHCDGQVQVLHDLLGLLPDFHPKHAKTYLNLHDSIREALRRYAGEVKAGRFRPQS